MSAQDVDVDALIRGRGSRRRWFVLAGATGVVAAAVIAFLAVQSGESDVVITPQRVEVTTGQLTTTVDLSGSAAAEQTSNLTFGIAGEVVAVEVEAGDEVTASQVLARFDGAQLELALREAELNLELQQAELAELTAARPHGRTAARPPRPRPTVRRRARRSPTPRPGSRTPGRTSTRCSTVPLPARSPRSGATWPRGRSR